MSTDLEFYVRCPFGLEKTVAGELAAMAIKGARPLSGGVAFFGSLKQAYRACLWLRSASRVLLVLGRSSARSADELYAGARQLAWAEHLSPASTFAVYARGVNAALRNTQFTALKVKDALCDAMVEVAGKRPNVATDRPDVRFEVSLRADKATLYLDLSGEPLHRREYRTPGVQGEAPIKENLAAGILLLSGWGEADTGRGASSGRNAARSVGDANNSHDGERDTDNASSSKSANGTNNASGTAQPPQLIFDPLCGTGTLLLEAACISTDRAPGLTRDYWGFLGWLGHDQAIWDELLDEADQRFEHGLEAARDQMFVGSDKDERAIRLAREAAKRLGFAELVQFAVAGVSETPATLSRACGDGRELPACGTIVSNPPYAHRLGAAEDLPALYAELSTAIAALPASWTLHLISADPSIDQHLLRTPFASETLYNGKIETRLGHYRLGDNVEQWLELQDAATNKPVRITVLDAGSEQFAARLKKVARERRKWAQREGISCYRLYDADLPDFAVAIDRYDGLQSGVEQVEATFYTVAEYKAPKEIDAAKAQRRYLDVLAVLPHVLGVSAQNIIPKLREQARGGEQYASYVEGGAAGTNIVVQEGAYRFLLDLSGHLDTGLFLDHRLTRALVAEQLQKMSDEGVRASGLRFLNLFAYTGTASVYAAAAGATQTTTVDLSNTYLEWAQKNMRLNGQATGEIELFRGDGVPSDAAANAGAAGAVAAGAAVNMAANVAANRFVRADVLEWLQAERRALKRGLGQAYDLIFVDPPTFSNSKRMGERTWDVQRDHAELLQNVAALLTKGGMAIFSCNLRSFKLDEAALQKLGIAVEDISASTIPPDFARNPKIHRCYIIRKAQ